MRLDLLDKFVEGLDKQARALKSFLKYREPETRITIFFAFGLLADQYLALSEDALKKGKGAEATYFSGKAAAVRQYTADVFKEAPEKDYYTGIYKIPEDIVLSVKPEKILQVAQFCVSNIELPRVAGEPAADAAGTAPAIRAELTKILRTQKTLGVFGKFSEVLLTAAKKQENPDKLQTIFECAVLLSNVQQTSQALKETGAKQKKHSGSLKAFRVKG